MRLLRFFFLGLMLASASLAFAGDVTFFGGFQHPGKITLFSFAKQAANAPGLIDLLSNPKNFGVLGARVGHGGKVVGLEHTLAVAPNFLDSRARVAILNSNLILHAPLVFVRPYVTGGVGLLRSSGEGPAAFGNKLALNYGGGLKFPLIGSVGTRIDVRGYTVPKVQGQKLNVVEVSVGVVFSY